jgi:hypothetical protein
MPYGKNQHALHLAARYELPVLVIHAVGEADMPTLLIIFGQELDIIGNGAIH